MTACALSAAADYAAGIAQQSIQLIRLYLDRGRMFREAGNFAAAAADIRRAAEMYRRAVEATECCNSAGQDVLYAVLDRLKPELESCQVGSKAAAA